MSYVSSTFLKKSAIFSLNAFLILTSTQAFSAPEKETKKISTAGRYLNCQVKDEYDASNILAEGKLFLDKKPDPKAPYPDNGYGYSQTIIRKKITVNGKTGKLYVRFTATYFDHYLNRPDLTNITDTFPKVDIMAFFYERQSDGTDAQNYSEIGVRMEGVPTLDVHNNRNRSQYGMWMVGRGAQITCLLEPEST